MYTALHYYKVVLGAKLDKFLHDEKGETSIVAMVVLIGIAVVLAIIFRNSIQTLIEDLLAKITTNADNAVGGAPAVNAPGSAAGATGGN